MKSTIEDVYPLSPVQAGMLFHSVLHEEKQQYFHQMVLPLAPSADLDAFKWAWSELVDRNPVMRTGIAWKTVKNPLQVVARRAQIPWTEHDYRHLPDEEQEPAARAFIEQDRGITFDLSKVMLMRMALLHTKDHCHFVWSHHHLILDGWCISLVFSELLALYRYRTGVSGQLPPRTRSFRDYVDFVSAKDMNELEQFWRHNLAGFDTPTAINVETIGAGADHEDDYGEVESVIDAATYRSMEQWIKQRQITINTLTQAGLAVVLSCYSGALDVVFGCTVSGRSVGLEDAEKIMGPLLNTLPIRVQLDPQMELDAWLASIQTSMGELHEYQYSPLVKINEWSELASQQNLFNCILVFENYPIQDFDDLFKGGFNFETIESYGKTNYPLTLVALPGEKLILRALYQSNRFEKPAMTRLTQHLKQVLLQICSGAKTIADLRVMTEGEQALLNQWNQTTRPYEDTLDIVAVFERHAQATPEKTALMWRGDTLTYAQVNQQANRLAHHLLDRPAPAPGRELLVGVAMESSFDLLISILAIVKAGGGYVPLNPNFPAERLQLMIQDSGLSLVITHQTAPAPPGGAPLLLLDQEHDAIAARPAENPRVQVPADQILYVNYTSGSTGTPKAVIISRRNVAAFVSDHDYIHMADTMTFVQVANPSFDAFTFEMWTTLLLGARLCIMGGDALQRLDEFPAALRDNGVTTMFLTTALFNQVIQADPTAFNHMDNVLFGGEQADPHTIRRLLKNGGPKRLIHCYGPTEATTYTTTGVLEHLAEGAVNVHIGKAMVNMTIHVLDKDLKPVPIKVPGELYIGGDGLARGYLNQPAMTAERFVPHPLSDLGARLYRTGDLVRVDEQGNIEFLGRVDRQVKVRGFRIEIPEIEYAVRNLDPVRDVFVTVKKMGANDNRLVAYVQPAAGRTPTSADIREALSQTLPDYMIPNAVLFLDSFPLNPNGKVDVKKLPDPEGELINPGDYTAPRTAVEELLCGMWSQVLGIGRVGVNHDFFELGGHSLLATQVTSRLRQTFERDVPLRIIFENPTVAKLAKAMDALDGEPRGAAAAPFVPRDPDTAPVLSFAQERVWFFNQLEATSAAYNIPTDFSIRGPLDRDRLERAFQYLIQRHESFRTGFTIDKGNPVMLIHDHLEWTLGYVDFSDMPAEEKAVAVTAKRVEEAGYIFDLAKPPLLRATLAQLEPDHCLLMLNIHHIVSDGWSTNLLLDELARVYGAFAQDAQPDLAPLPIQYSDFAAWQRTYLSGDELERQLAFWKHQLAGVHNLELPTDHARPPVQTYRGAIHAFTMPTALIGRLNQLSLDHNVSLFMTLTAAFQTLLHRYTGQNDIAIGSPIANRNRGETERIIGFFVNTLVLRGDLSGSPTFVQLLKRIRAVCLAAFAHQDVPFEKVVDAMDVERDLSRHALVQVMFTLQNLLDDDIDFPELDVRMEQFDSSLSKFDLTLSLRATDAGMEGLIEYSTDLFDADRIQRMGAHFEVLLTQIAATPNAPISHLPVLTADEIARIRAYNSVTADYPTGVCSHELVEAQAKRRPDAAALSFGDQVLTYQQMESRVNRLARHMIQYGVGPGSVVGIFMDRSMDRVCALLAVLKAGGIFMPMDPAYPRARLEWMLEDSATALLLTTESLQSKLPASDAKAVYLDRDRHLLERGDDRKPEGAIHPLNPAYLIYTSGSTGRPKGVLLHHVGLCNLVTNHHNFLGVDESDKIFQFAAFGFDAAVWETFMALCNGACLHLAPDDVGKSPDLLARELVEHQITTVTLPPTMLRLLPFNAGTGPKRLVSAGEACSRELVDRYAPARLFVNAYGPTEATVCATWLKTQPDNGKPTIGGCLDNVEVYVLDPNMQILPFGHVGEIYIGGAGLALGYLNQPAMTAAKFVPHPYTAKQGHRLYATGDLGMMRADGQIDFIGRVDFQVKLHGYRIELGEIEAVIAAADHRIRGVVVIDRLVAESRKLIAYVAVDGGVDMDTNRLRNILDEKLPHYMIPAAFVYLEELPLTTNGKIDREALPDPAAAGGMATAAYIKPETEAEIILAQIWEEVLAAPRVGLRDNFFKLGGDSIVSIRMIALARERGLSITPKQVFQHQTVQELASVAAEVAVTRAEQGILEGSVPMAPIQHWFFETMKTDRDHWNQSVLLAVNCALDPEHLRQTMKLLVEHHDMVRLRAAFTDGKPSLAYAAAPETAVPIELIQIDPAADIETAIAPHAARAQSSLSLTEGPLMRAVVFQRGDQGDHLLLATHHMIVDGVSWRILMEDLIKVYTSFQNGKTPALPEKTSSYRQWTTHLQDNYFQVENRAAELDYWTAATRRIRALPRDFSGAAVADTAGAEAVLSRQLSADQTLYLLTGAHDAYHTRIDDLLLTALARAHARWTGYPDVTLNLESHGRVDLFENVDLTRTLGWFTASYPVYLDTRNAEDPGEAVRAVKETLRRVPNSGLGYGILRYLDAEAGPGLADRPPIELSFNYLGQFDQGDTSTALLRIAPEDPGPQQSPNCPRPHLIDVTAVVMNGVFQVRFGYHPKIHSQRTIDQFAHGFLSQLSDLLEHCRDPEAGGYSPSDFSDMDMSQEELDDIMDELDLD